MGMEIYEGKNVNGSFREILLEEFNKRCHRNPKYSLRAFARSIRVDPSLLSKFFKGERGLSKKTIFRLGQAVNVPFSQISQVKELQVKANNNVEYKQIDEEFFEPISDWYYFAILELLQVKGRKVTPRWIAMQLGITAAQVHFAMERLESLGCTKQDAENSWTVTQPNQKWSTQAFTSESRKQLQKQFLSKAIEAIDACPFEKRENSSLTLAMDKNLIPTLKKKIQAFKQEVLQLASDSKNYNSVYQLNLALFPLAEPEPDKTIDSIGVGQESNQETKHTRDGG
jgi:transcriptional regulator with XRE-family HTH domain